MYVCHRMPYKFSVMEIWAYSVVGFISIDLLGNSL